MIDFAPAPADDECEDANIVIEATLLASSDGPVAAVAPSGFGVCFLCHSKIAPVFGKDIHDVVMEHLRSRHGLER